MAAAADSIARASGRHDSGRWVAAAGDHSRAEIPGMIRLELGHAGSPPMLTVYAEDVAGGPSRAAADGCAAVFEGSLYHAAELAALLDAPDCAANPAALALRAYRRWGRDFPGELRGRFALLLSDSGRGLVLAARDQTGIHPCFFARAGREYLVSSDAENLLRHPGVSREINRCMVVDYMSDYWPSLSETFYASVRRVPPGSMMCAEGGAEKIHRYWNPRPIESDTQWAADDDVERFDALLVRAIDRSLDRGPAGIYLSGGLDSVSVAAVATDRAAARGMPKPYALSIAFRDSEADEEERQRAVAHKLGLAQEVLPFYDASNPAGFMRGALELAHEMTFPLINMWLARYNDLARLGRAHGCRAILTGSGGDEWLGVTPFLAADLMRSLDFAGLYRLWRITRRSYQRPTLQMARFFLWSAGMRALVREAAIKSLTRVSPASLDAIRWRRMIKAAPRWLTLDAALDRQIRDRVAATQTCPTSDPGPYGMYFAEARLSLDHPLVSWELEETFENGRRLGVEFIHPYWDAELVETLWRTPPALLNHGGRSKGLVRQVVAKRFPALGFERQRKVEVGEYFFQLVARDARAIWREMGGAKALVKLGLADNGKLDLYIDGILGSKEHTFAQACKIFNIMTIDTWLRSRI
jgi:asparagine synthase (glutamine-hydrolysing)